MRIFLSEHDAERTMPALCVQTLTDHKCSPLLLPHTRAVRLHADDDCLVAIGKGEPADAWTRLAADVTEWFDIAKDHVGVRVWIKADE